MKQVVLNIEENRYVLFLQFLKTLQYVQVVQTDKTIDEPKRKSGYDFSDLAGKINWEGDAVAEQRLLRDEW